METRKYTLYVHSSMVEIRTIDAPDGLTAAQLADYSEQHGYGDMTDVCEDRSQLVQIEDDKGHAVWSNVDTRLERLADTRKTIIDNIDYWLGDITDLQVAAFMRDEGHADWSGDTMSDIRRLKRDLSLPEADSLASMLGIDVSQLFSRAGEGHPGRIITGLMRDDGTIQLRIPTSKA